MWLEQAVVPLLFWLGPLSVGGAGSVVSSIPTSMICAGVVVAGSVLSVPSDWSVSGCCVSLSCNSYWSMKLSVSGRWSWGSGSSVKTSSIS